MSITVSDCLKLPSLQEANVIAGHGGLDKFVSAVSVLEYARVFAMADPLFLGNELIITAFTSVMDDVEAQCNAIRRLHEVGESALVLYYVGYYVKTIDKKLIDTANELDFPLIVMPVNNYSLRYNEVIIEVLEKIFEERKKATRFVPLLLKQISAMRERQRTASGILRILSDHLRYSFLLLDSDGREQGLAIWPTSLSQELIDGFRDCADAPEQFPATLTYHDKQYEVRQLILDTKHHMDLRLYVMAEAGGLNGDFCEQAGEVVETSYNLWRSNLKKGSSDDLVRMILNEQNRDIYRIAGNLRIDLRELRIMWAILPKGAVGVSEDAVSQQKQQVKEYLCGAKKTAIVDVFDQGIVAFMNDAPYPGIDGELAQDFMAEFGRAHPDTVLIWCGGLDSILDTRRAYMLIEQYCSTACVIYPHKSIITHQDLLFAETCHSLMQGDAAALEHTLSVLAPLAGQKDEKDTWETLGAYLIDADKSTSAAASVLHVHESTVKYRLNKINRRLGYDITQMPATYYLYLALAIRRLRDFQAGQ